MNPQFPADLNPSPKPPRISQNWALTIGGTLHISWYFRVKTTVSCRFFFRIILWKLRWWMRLWLQLLTGPSARTAAENGPGSTAAMPCSLAAGRRFAFLIFVWVAKVDVESVYNFWCFDRWRWTEREREREREGEKSSMFWYHDVSCGFILIEPSWNEDMHVANEIKSNLRTFWFSIGSIHDSRVYMVYGWINMCRGMGLIIWYGVKKPSPTWLTPALFGNIHAKSEWMYHVKWQSR